MRKLTTYPWRKLCTSHSTGECTKLSFEPTQMQLLRATWKFLLHRNCKLYLIITERLRPSKRWTRNRTEGLEFQNSFLFPVFLLDFIFCHYNAKRNLEVRCISSKKYLITLICVFVCFASAWRGIRKSKNRTAEGHPQWNLLFPSASYLINLKFNHFLAGSSVYLC